jgi:hypothetical protein
MVAYNFIRNHPKFRLKLQVEICAADLQNLPKKMYEKLTFNQLAGKQKILRSKQFNIIPYLRFDGTLLYIEQYNAIFMEAVNFINIDYVLTNDKGRISRNKKENKFLECWLEFGPIAYPTQEEFTDSYRLRPDQFETTHDPALDCGGKTFDEAIVKLAKLVRKKYGNY